MGFEFIADVRALDFVATVSERGTTDAESLGSPADLARWMREARLVDEVEAPSEREFRHALRVREALFVLIAALTDGNAPPGDARDVVNAAAVRPGPRTTLDGEGRVHRSGGVSAVLAVLAREVIALHDSPDRLRLRWCDDARCTRPFIDRSRGRARRWCGMQGCGDRAKAAAYRRRQRDETRRPGADRR